MLRTTIVTRDERTGEELPVPKDLREKVQRASEILEQMLARVGKRIDIHARWWFEPVAAHDFDVMLSLSTKGKGIGYPFPKDRLSDDESIRRSLWGQPIGHLIPELSEEVDREFENVRRGLEALATSAED